MEADALTLREPLRQWPEAGERPRGVGLVEPSDRGRDLWLRVVRRNPRGGLELLQRGELVAEALERDAVEELPVCVRRARTQVGELLRRREARERGRRQEARDEVRQAPREVRVQQVLRA